MTFKSMTRRLVALVLVLALVMTSVPFAFAGTANYDSGRAVATDANGSATDPNGATYPNGSATNPNGSATNPDGSATDPDGSATDPDGEHRIAVESIQFEDMDVIVGTRGYYDSYYDDETGYETEYFAYRLQNPNYTVTMSNGDVIEMEDNFEDDGQFDSTYFYYRGNYYEIQFRSNQSYHNQWGLGQHSVTAWIDDAEDEFTLNVIESPIESIVFEPMTVVEGTAGYVDSDDDGLYYRYIGFTNWNYTVTFKNGYVIEHSDDDEHQGFYIDEKYYYIEYSNNQSAMAPWGVGEHQVTAKVAGYETTYPYIIEANPIDRIEFEPLTMVEYTGGYWDEDWIWDSENEQETYAEFYRYRPYNPNYKVVLKSGETVEVEGDEHGFVLDGEYYEISFMSNQSPINQWGLGAHSVTAWVAGKPYEFTTNIIENPIASIEFETKTIPYGTGGEYDWYWDEDTGEEFRYYLYSVENNNYTVSFKDGTTLTHTDDGEENGFYYEGVYYPVTFSSGQTGRDPWEYGETYTAIGSIGSCSAEFDVLIDKAPIKNIEIDKKTVIEGTAGLYVGEDENQWFKYGIHSWNFVVTMEDGTVIEEMADDDPSFYYNGFRYYFDVSSDQSAAHPWNVGIHTVNVSVGGYETSYEYEIVESPVKSVEISDVKVVEKTNGEYTTDWDEFGEEVDWFKYDFYSILPKYTVIMKDGTELSGDADGFIYDDQWYSVEYTSDQSWMNPWGLGQHTVTLNVLGCETDFNIEIIESPVKSIEFKDKEAYELISGWYREWESDEDWGEYFFYTLTNYEYTVEMYNGDKVVHTENDETSGFYYDDAYYNLEFSSDQSHNNQWGLGPHEVSVRCGEVASSFTLTVVSTPIAKIDFAPLKLVEGVNGYIDYEWVDWNDEDPVEWFHYDIEPRSYTVEMKDGTVLTDDNASLYFDGFYYKGDFFGFKFDGQSYEEPWSAGSHKGIVNCGTYSTEVDVNIIENNVKSIVFDPVYNKEYTNGEEWYYDDYDSSYFKYDLYAGTYTVTMDDGTVLTEDNCVMEEYGFYYDGAYYKFKFDSDQDSDCQWHRGPHEGTVYVGDYETTIPFFITKDGGPCVEHEFQALAGTPSTCTEQGYEEYACINCYDARVTYRVELPLADHVFKNYVSDDNATCMEDGTKTAKCENCTATETITDEGTQLEHVYSSTYTIDKKASTTEDGSKSKHCTNSQCTARDAVTVIPKISTMTLSVSKYTYDGIAKQPTVTLKDSEDNVLKNGTDYTVSYKNNVNAGTATATITCKGIYEGTMSENFIIDSVSIANAEVILDSDTFTYTGSSQGPAVIAKVGETTLVEGTDYTITGGTTGTAAGTYTFTIVGQGNYAGSIDKTFTIDSVDMANAEVILDSDSFTYTGSSQGPAVTVKVGETTLVEGTDYTITGDATGKVAGTYTFTIDGQGNYAGSIDKNFTIDSVDMANAEVILDSDTFTYTGSSQGPAVIVKVGETTLVESTDYTITGDTTGTAAGTYTFTIVGQGNYAGSIDKTFTIGKAALTGIKASGKTVTYNGSKHTITLKGVPTGAKVYYKTSSKGTYTTTKPTRTSVGTTTIYYKVSKANYNDVTGSAKIVVKKATLAGIKVTGKTVTYNGSKHTITLKGVPTGAKVYYKTSKNGKYTTTKPTRTSAGTTTVYYKISKTNYNDVTGSVKIVVNKRSISKASLSATTYVYNGKAKKPTVTVKNSSGTKLKNGTHYTVSYKNNTKVGKATVTITGKGNYKGTITKTFTINPKATKITSLKKEKKSFTVKWSKVTSQTSGYQIYYTTSTTRKNGKTYTVKSNKTTSKKFTGLKSKKKYYVWVRTYKTVNGKKYYSAWSARDYITTK